MQESLDHSACGCPRTTASAKKQYQEIGAEVIGNQLLIRVERDAKRKVSQWEPPCDCEIPEIRRASRTQGPRLLNAGDDNQILFRINSRSQVNSDDPNFRPEIISYRLGEGAGDSHGRTIVVHPQLEGAGSQEIQRDHITVGNQNIFMMRIKKKPDAREQRKRNVELEVRYPKLPPRPPTPPPPPPPPPVEAPKEAEEPENNEKPQKTKKKKK